MDTDFEVRELRQITVVVYSARDLQAHKKGDVCHASVVFGHGKDFYTTEMVESPTPEWNQEASISIANHFQEPIRFKVKDKEHTLGSVTVPLSGLNSSPNKLWLPLMPHKKASEVHGSLQVGCWVTSYREKERPSEDVQLQNSYGTCGLEHNSPSSSRHERGGSGVQDDMQPEQDKAEAGVPEVTGVSPNEGPVEGGQRVVLRGSYLGTSREDIVQILVAGVNCTSSLEYFSPSKLAVVTAPRAAQGSGPVVVHTQTGGTGVSWINFSFVVSKDTVVSENRRKIKNDSTDSALMTELKSYKQQVKELKDTNKSLCEENEQLRGYINRLLVGVLTHSPGVLEVHSCSDPVRPNLTQ